MYGENRYAKEWINRFNRTLEAGVYRLVDPNGQGGETVAYMGFGVTPNMLTALAIKKVQGGEDPFGVAEGRLEKLTRTLVYLISPNGQSTRDFGDTGGAMQLTSHGGLGSGITGMLCALSRSTLWPDVARWAAHRGIHTYGKNDAYKVLNPGRSPIMNILLFKPGEEKSPVDSPQSSDMRACAAIFVDSEPSAMTLALAASCPII